MSTEPTTSSTNSYDEVPYPSHPFPSTHPDRLATVARLFGMRAPDTTRARVLELGCASGGNILPIADSLPQATFVGFDLSSRQIAEGQQAIRESGLSNVTLEQKNILEISSELGQFDYIICHGVYSWVPREVQDKILAICREQLTPQGVAYVSYNTYPGWHMRGMIRDMMMYHSSRFKEPQVRVQQARALLDFMTQSISQENSAYSVLLKTELDILLRQSDAYLLHDHLEVVNDPIYFHHFIERANAAGLQYLGESNISAMSSGNFSPNIEKTLHLVANGIIQMEQYMDFLRNRMFRQTLLCRQGVALNRQITGASVRGFFFSAALRAENPDHDLRSKEPQKFVGLSGANVVTPDPLMKAALTQIGRAWPAYISLDSLVRGVRDLLKTGSEADALQPQSVEFLAEGVMRCVARGLIDIRVHAPQFTTEISERPTSSGLMRYQAARGGLVTNRRHDSVQIDDVDRFVLPKLDGTRTLDDLARTIVDAVNSGVMTVSLSQTVAPNEPGQLETLGRQAVTQCLQRLARSALLIQ